MMRCPQHSIRTSIVIFILVCVATVSLFIPPFQSPDEDSHLLRADMIAHGHWLLQSENGITGREGGLVDANFREFAASMLSIAGKGVNKAPASTLFARADEVSWSDQQIFEKAAGTGYYLPLIYAPHALGLYISRQLDLTMRSSYAVTRGVVLLTSVALIGWALSLYTPNVLSLMLLMTPMALFQLSSPTIDGLCFAMAMAVIGLWFHLSDPASRSEKKKISGSELALYGMLLVLCTARANLLPLLLIPLLLLNLQYTRPRLLAVGILYLTTLGWIAFGILTTYDSRVIREYSTSEIFVKYLTNPGEFFDLVNRTLSNVTIRRFYRDSFFGVLGWLDTPIPRQAVRILAVTVTLTALVLAFTTRWRQAIITRLSLMITGFTSTVLVFVAMAVSWTNYPAQTISGIQGRYFLIPCLFMASALGPTKAGPRSLGSVEIAVIALFFFYSLYLLITTLAMQYAMVNIPW